MRISAQDSFEYGRSTRTNLKTRASGAESTGKGTSVRVLHAVSGRIRLQVPSLKEDTFDSFVSKLSRGQGVFSAHASIATGSVVVKYWPEKTNHERVLRYATSLTTRLQRCSTALSTGQKAAPPVSKQFTKNLAAAQRVALELRDGANAAAERSQRKRKLRRIIARYGPDVALAILGIGLTAVEGPLGLAFAGLTEVGRLSKIVRRGRS
jgi:hypothetical protein